MSLKIALSVTIAGWSIAIAGASAQSSLNPGDFNLTPVHDKQQSATDSVAVPTPSSSTPAASSPPANAAGFDSFRGPLFQTNVSSPMPGSAGDSAGGNRSTTPKTNPSPDSGAGGNPAPDEAKDAAQQFHPVIIRLKRYRSLQEMEVVWEAAYMANIMLAKGAQVTVLLDMDAVHAASTGDTSFSSLEPCRGQGSSAGVKLTTPQDQLSTFTAGGGKLVANSRWAKIFGMLGAYGSPFIQGIKFIDDGEIADLLLQKGSEVIDY